MVSKEQKFNEKRDKIVALTTERKRLKAELETLSGELRSECSHVSVIQNENSPPSRICLICGTEEESYNHGNGFKVLWVKPVRTVERGIFNFHRELQQLTTEIVSTILI